MSLRRFTERFGAIARQLLSMPDFRPVRLVPESGRFVIGFGAAFEVQGADLSRLVHRDGGGSGHGHGAADGAHTHRREPRESRRRRADE